MSAYLRTSALDIFAADLWEVYQQRGPSEYKDATTFFEKTYMTQGLENLLKTLEKRLQGKGGDPVIQLQTPFGGGKTHTLISMFHKAEEWGAKRVVLSGTALDTKETMWGTIEQQLTGKISKFSEKVAPGKEIFRELLVQNQPILILMDEVLQYVTRAAGVKVEASNLAVQTTAFLQELTEIATTIEKFCFVITLPKSENYGSDENSEKILRQLEKLCGRVEKIYTPVQENEIAKIIRRRLFSQIDEAEVKKIVKEFMGYAESQEILPAGVEPIGYQGRFVESYPFMPEVIDILYHYWGSFPTFQRTRGVLRLLALVIGSLKSSKQPYISLADFDLSNQEIRQELLKHVGTEFNSVLSADIIHEESGAKKVDKSLGNAYQGLNLGTRTATTIFLYSFSGGSEHGANTNQIKRSATTTQNPSSIISEASEQLRNKLFYLQYSGEKYFFSNTPNLNRILLTKIENIKEEKTIELEQELLKKSLKTSLQGNFKIFLWEENPANIQDTEDLKLILIKQEDKKWMEHTLKNKGQTPRVYRNTLFFLYPLESERSAFLSTIKRKIAFEAIEEDSNLRLSEEQKKDIKKELKKLESDAKEAIRKLYRMITVPARDGFKEPTDLGIPTYGEENTLDQEVYKKLRSEGYILEKIAPLVLKEKYLSRKEYVLTDQLYQSTLKTPGETRLKNREVLEQGIEEGVKLGIFGLGDLEAETPQYRYFKEKPKVSFHGNEILIQTEICQKQKSNENSSTSASMVTPGKVANPTSSFVSPSSASVSNQKTSVPVPPTSNKIETVVLKFRVPKGKVSNIMGVMNLLQSKFETLEIEIIAKDGEISKQDYEDKIEETFKQLGIDLKIQS